MVKKTPTSKKTGKTPPTKKPASSMSINDVLEKNINRKKINDKKKATKKKAKKDPERNEVKNYTHIADYICALSSYERPEGGWFFALELLTKEGSLYEIPGQRIYETYQDSLLDGFGVLEYMGFHLVKDSRAELVVNSWDASAEEYRESLVYFDGLDFYQDPTKSPSKS